MDKPPKVMQFALLALAFAGFSVWAWRGFGPGVESAKTSEPVSAETLSSSQAEPEHGVLITYFTSDQRCPTCLKIEKLTRQAVDGGFASELAAGTIRFQTINFDRPENKHYINDYALTFKTVVISERHQGKQTKWEKYDKVWDLVGDPEAFTAYLQEGIRAHLKSTSDA